MNDSGEVKSLLLEVIVTGRNILPRGNQSFDSIRDFGFSHLIGCFAIHDPNNIYD